MNGTWTARCSTDPGGATELRVSDGLESSHLLVPSLYELRIVVGPPPCGEQSIDAVARITKYLRHPPLTQSVQQHVRNRLIHWTPRCDGAAKGQPSIELSHRDRCPNWVGPARLTNNP